METILCADIGGTNTRLLLFNIQTDSPLIELPVAAENVAPGTLLFRKQYSNEKFETFIAIVKTFLEEAGISKPPVTACLAVAGPVKNNVVRFTNRADWVIDGDEIARALGIKVVKLINDFLAAGYGLLTLNKETECVTIQKGQIQKDAPIACVGAGTGLGECFLTPDDGGQYRCFPCEGGHAEFSPRNDLEIGLLKFLKDKFKQKNRVSVERVVSGTGLVNIFEFLCVTFPREVNADIVEEVNNAGDLKGAVIASYQDRDELCKETMKIFIQAYGAEAGVAALKWLPYGGLFLAGGLTPKNINAIKWKSGLFMESFMDKGRVSGMLADIPVYAVMVENIGERGAHFVAYKDLQAIVKESKKSVSTSQNASQPPQSSSTTETNNIFGTIIITAVAASVLTLWALKARKW